MIQLNKRLYLKAVELFEIELPIIGILEHGRFSYAGLTWKHVELGRRLAHKRGLLRSKGKRGHRVYFTKLGKAMLKLTE